MEARTRDVDVLVAVANHTDHGLAAAICKQTYVNLT